MPITQGFNHVAILTPDLDRLVRFYEEAFGAEATFEMGAEDGHPRMIILDLGLGACLNAFEVGPDEIIGERRRIGARGAIDHFALAVESLAVMEIVASRIVAAHGEVGEIQRLGDEWSLFFRDPDDMELEVCCPVTE